MGENQEIPLITGVDMPCTLQACRIDMEGHKVYRYCILIYMPPVFRERAKNSADKYSTILGVPTG